MNKLLNFIIARNGKVILSIGEEDWCDCHLEIDGDRFELGEMDLSSLVMTSWLNLKDFGNNPSKGRCLFTLWGKSHSALYLDKDQDVVKILIQHMERKEEWTLELDNIKWANFNQSVDNQLMIQSETKYAPLAKCISEYFFNGACDQNATEIIIKKLVVVENNEYVWSLIKNINPILAKIDQRDEKIVLDLIFNKIANIESKNVKFGGRFLKDWLLQIREILYKAAEPESGKV